MSESPMDPERLAAFLDGRLDERARAALLAELAESPEARELLGEAAAVLRELEETDALGFEPAGGQSGAPTPAAPVTPPLRPLHLLDAAPTPPPLPPPPGRPYVDDPTPPRVVDTSDQGARQGRWIRRGALAAAAVALVAVGVWSRTRAGGDALASPAALVALIDTPAPAGGDALTPVPWPVMRGAADGLSARARAVRYGALAVELELAAAAGDTATVALRARQIAELLGGLSGSGLVAALARETSAAPEARRDLWDTSLTLFDEAGIADARLGSWLVAMRVAATRQDAAMLRHPASRRTLEALGARADLPATAGTASERLRAASVSRAIPDWATVVRDVETLLMALGS